MEFEAIKRAPFKSMNCQHCKGIVEFYHYSGMGDLAPHFYCDSCSNILFREEDSKKLYNCELTEELFDEITKDLPACTCGGKFRAEANPKCPHCKQEIKHQDSPLNRLRDPYAIQLKDAYLLKPSKVSHEQTDQSSQEENHNPVQGIGCLLVFMGIMGATVGLLGLSGLVSNVELGFFGIELNDQAGRVYWVIGCVISILLGAFIAKKSQGPKDRKCREKN
jgi:hypothetical protein